MALPFEFPCLQAIRKRNEATVSERNYKVFKETCEICPSAKNAKEKLLLCERRKNVQKMQNMQNMQKQNIIVKLTCKKVVYNIKYE